MSTSAKAALLEEFTLVARALAAPARLMILEHLAQAPRAVEPLAAKTGLSVANCSQHLQQLRRAGLITGQRQGKSVIYQLSDAKILDLMDLLRVMAERNLAQVERILRGIAGGDEPPEPLDRDALAVRLAEGTVTLLDIRPEDEFALGHIPGALNVPLDALESALPELRPDREIIAYCRGPFCIYADQAVAALRQKGLAARRMEGGLPEWREDGRPVELVPA